MLNPQESAIELKKYLKKLQNLLSRDAIFSLGDTKIMDKNKIDDILCCVDACWPKDYLDYVKSHPKKLQSNTYYIKLLGAIKNRFLFFTTVYAVRHRETIALIGALVKSLDSDINFIYSDKSGMF